MKVEIWSDVMCPFCYIGKRRFEAALEQFGHKDKVEIQWKSFQLQPGLKTDASKNSVQHLAETKGWTMDYAREMTSYVTNMAKEAGLEYKLESAVVANSFDAHRLSHYATEHGKGNELEEQLFKAYFTEGKNTADHGTLTELAESAGLNQTEVETMLASEQFANAVHQDIIEAQQMGINGVPFFIFNRKFVVSGAQSPETFLGALQKAWDGQE